MTTTMTVQLTVWAEGDLGNDLDNLLEDDSLKEDLANDAAMGAREGVASALAVPTKYIKCDATLLRIVGRV